MIIHGGSPSPFARKVMVAFEEKGMPFESKDLAPFPKSPELLAMNPIGKIPILELSDGTYIADSSVICAYLERVHPQPALLPEDPVAYARALFIEEYCDTILFSAISTIYFERYIKPNLFETECDEAAVAAKIEEELEPTLDQLEGLIPDACGPLYGDAFSLADIALGAQLSSLALARVEIDAARWPKISAYSAWVLGRDSFAKVLATLP